MVPSNISKYLLWKRNGGYFFLFAHFGGRSTFVPPNNLSQPPNNPPRSSSFSGGVQSAKSFFLDEIEKHLSTMSSINAQDIDLPSVPPSFPPLGTQENQLWPEVLRRMALKSISRFNAEQRKVFNEVVGALMPGLTTSAIDEKPSNEAPTEWLLILDTPGETGKTFVTSSKKKVSECYRQKHPCWFIIFGFYTASRWCTHCSFCSPNFDTNPPGQDLYNVCGLFAGRQYKKH